jgi:hypothetical protein
MNESSGDTKLEAAALAESLTNQAETPAPQQEQVVPVHVVQSIREELKAVKEQNEAFKNHLNMMQWQQQSQQQPAPQPPDPFKDIDPEDSIKAKDAFRIVQELTNRFESRLAEVKIAQKSSDYGEVIKKYLPLAAQEDPELMQDIQRSSNPYKMAYNAVKASKAYQEDVIRDRLAKEQPAPKAQPEAERVVKNARQSGNISSVASNTTPSGQFPSFSNMSDDEFRQFKASRSLRPSKVT